MKTAWSKVLCGWLAVAIVAVLYGEVAHAAPRLGRRAMRRTPVAPPAVYVPYAPSVVYQPVPRNPMPAVYLANPIFVSQGIALVNPPESGVTLRFRLDGVAYQLAAGARAELDHSAAHTIEFDRGGDFGLARYRLTEGDYYFRETDQGWTLQQKPHTVPSVAME